MQSSDQASDILSLKVLISVLKLVKLRSMTSGLVLIQSSQLIALYALLREAAESYVPADNPHIRTLHSPPYSAGMCCGAMNWRSAASYLR